MGKDLIVKVIFKDIVMMFGNSYKPWHIQCSEFLWEYKRIDQPLELVNVEVSKHPWISFGGLKWCPEDCFQQQLNREGCQEKDADNPNPRQYSEMQFFFDGRVYNKVKKLLEKTK